VVSVSTILLVPPTQRGGQHNAMQNKATLPAIQKSVSPAIDAVRCDSIRYDTIHGITINPYETREKNNTCSSFFDSFSSLLEEIIKSIRAKAKQ